MLLENLKEFHKYVSMDICACVPQNQKPPELREMSDIRLFSNPANKATRIQD